MREVTISLVSGPTPELAREDVGDTEFELIIDYWSDRISQVLPDRPDLIVLPELFDRPKVSGQPTAQYLSGDAKTEFIHAKGTRIRDALAEIAVANSTYVTHPSYRVAEDGAVFNSMEFIGRDGGTAAVYDKIMPTLGELEGVVSPGREVLAADLDFGRVSAAICFDLNFEQLRTAIARVHPELIVFASAYHGGLVQNHWALSCRSYFVGCVYPPNRSTMINPTGHEVASTSTYDFLLTRTLNLDYVVVHLGYNRDKLTRLKARYGPEVLIEDPGLVGMVLVSSRATDVTARQMIDEFEIQDLDGYFADSAAHLEPHGITVPSGAASRP
ncbi:carbon-nitrogen hydrolase family protein [Propionibacteriaceae bacterium Y2011]|uniref:carbon-nitrogen hydrolase family protein n=1 Tax=Microlunatus sp. Y2014 TaxID=3418488 RepID=UPI003B494FF9